MLMSSVEFTRPGRRDERREKTTLFCPTCGHESSATDEGDWLVTEHDRDGEHGVAYVCPDCGETLTVQPLLSQ